MHFFYVKLSMCCFMIFMTRLRSQYHETLQVIEDEQHPFAILQSDVQTI